MLPAGHEAVGKEVIEGRARRRYDAPLTPLYRLIDSHAGELVRVCQLVDLYTSTSPLTLKRRLDRRLEAMPAALGKKLSA